MIEHQYILIDTHVHLYEHYKIEIFLRKLHSNFLETRDGFGIGGESLNVIILTEGRSDPGLKKIFDFFDKSDSEDTVGKTENYQLADSDHHSFALIQMDDSPLLALSGRQIISKDNIEVLALGTTSDFIPELKTEQIIENVSKDGGVPVLPWGVGKWLGKRGKIISKILQNPNLPRFFIGDSANRPVFWPEPSQFGIARANEIKNLPGSDPLPVKHGYKNAGRAGILLNSPLNIDDPVHSIKSILLDPSSDIQPYMKRENPFSFLRNHFVMQNKKHFGYDNR